MKKQLLFILFAFISFSTFAQRGQDSEEKIQALKIAFITQKLKLTAPEAEKFWPVYNKYQDEVRTVPANRTGDVLENEEKLLNIRKKYKPSFEKILGGGRANQLYNVEGEFRNLLIRRLKNRGN